GESAWFEERSHTHRGGRKAEVCQYSETPQIEKLLMLRYTSEQVLSIHSAHFDLSESIKLTVNQHLFVYVCASVSGWTGQPQSVCLFHKGDRVVAINDLQTDSVEDFYMFISKSMKDEVKSLLATDTLTMLSGFHVNLGCLPVGGYPLLDLPRLQAAHGVVFVSGETHF
uniref:PDZ domain-containing protein n=1 Tax=Xiphophorus couchianus TaxID=32473 RepID=A0A3B5LKD2_9TELE